jgi:hypothetical protein
LHSGASRLLAGLVLKIREATETQNADALRIWSEKLHNVLQLIEPAFALDPPAPPDTLPWNHAPSRWQFAEGEHRQRAANSKKHILAKLPIDWTERLWKATPEGWKYRDALAVHLVVPVRAEELVPGQRPSGWSPGIAIELHNIRHLALTFSPVKSHNGLYGTERTTICFDPVLIGGAAQHLADKCISASGRTIVSTPSKNAVRKALEDLATRALPEVSDTMTPSVCRHQIIADLKTTLGGGEMVAAAAGHSTDRTQARYGNVQHGRMRRCYISVGAKRVPECRNVERARRFSRRAELRTGPDTG